MLDFSTWNTVEPPLAAETNVWDAILVLLQNRTELVNKVINFASSDAKAECQKQIDDIDARVEYLTEV